jgi:hypothetical protein
MTRVAGSHYLRQLEVKLWTVAKIQNLRVAVETFDPDDPDYNPSHTALLEIHCSVKPAPRPHGPG